MTDLVNVKKNSKMLFDAISFKDAMIEIDGEFSEMFLSHPFTNCGITFDPKSNTPLNLVKDEKAAQIYRNRIFKQIDRASNVFTIMLLLNKPYYLFWFKLIHNYLSEEDYNKLLKEVWICSENPNQDVNVSLKESLSFFKRSNPNLIMDEEEKRFYDSCAEEMIVYRGVSRNRNAFWLSYTWDKEKSIWFQNRFSRNDNDSFLITLQVRKKDCICYINERGEKEFVLDVFKYKKEIEEQVKRGN